MSNKTGEVCWEDYIEQYAEFIKKYKVSKFFELDIDKIVGYEEVLRLRKKLELLTGKQPIPVWHKSRGAAEFKKMCQEYKYVAVGGIVSKEITPSMFKLLPTLIDEAHRQGCKIHGLGFTNQNWLGTVKWDSVDSTSWLSGGRFGKLYQFNGNTLIAAKKREGKRLRSSLEAHKINFVEWCKYQRFAEVNL